MGLDDMFSTESAFVAGATAAVFSPKTRETIRKGAVYGVAGALKVGDVVAGAARGVVNGVRGEQAEANGAAPAAPASPPARTSGSGSSSRGTRATGAGRSGSSRTSRSGSGGSRSGARRAAATAKSGGTATG